MTDTSFLSDLPLAGTLVGTSVFDILISSADAISDSRARLFDTSSACARICSTGPNFSISWMAVLGPIPRAPGMLSDESPMSAR